MSDVNTTGQEPIRRSVPPVVLKCLASGLIVVVLASYLMHYYTDQTITRLYLEGSGYSTTVNTVKEMQASVRKLATYSGARSTELLLKIALENRQFVWAYVREEAIKALESRPDPHIAESLSGLLQPHCSLRTGIAVAQVLKTLPCNDVCVTNVLHYLERTSGGEMLFEDRVIYSPPLGEAARRAMQREKEALSQALFDVLRNRSRATVAILSRVYGLGTEAPSNFGLALISRIHLREACPVLVRSVELMKQRPAQAFIAPRDEAESAFRTLNCQ